MRLVLVTVFLSALLSFSGCSPVVKQRLLRTFFDGVPAESNTKKEEANKSSSPSKNKDIPVQETKGSIPEKTQESVVYKHPPFAERACDSCHESKFSQKLIAKGKELCFSCHEDFTKDKKLAHFPVVEGQCLECHEAHQSQNKALLKKKAPELCFNCHGEKEVKVNPVHEGQIVCLDCHNPHVSNEEKLLK